MRLIGAQVEGEQSRIRRKLAFGPVSEGKSAETMDFVRGPC